MRRCSARITEGESPLVMTNNCPLVVDIPLEYDVCVSVSVAMLVDQRLVVVGLLSIHLCVSVYNQSQNIMN